VDVRLVEYLAVHLDAAVNDPNPVAGQADDALDELAAWRDGRVEDHQIALDGATEPEGGAVDQQGLTRLQGWLHAHPFNVGALEGEPAAERGRAEHGRAGEQAPPGPER
jgi:hypothetical protein